MLFIIGVLVGLLIGALVFWKRTVGDLRVDRSDPSDQPYLFLELDRDVRDIIKKKKVTLKIRDEDFLPRR